MARGEGRGGYREPSGGPRAAGVGANSQRTDAAQPIRVARVSDAEDLTHGDRQKLEAAQRIAPLGRPQTQRIATGTPRAAGGAVAGANGMPADIPEYIFSKPSTRPGEPETTGMELGPGAGPEALQMNNEPETEQEIALQFLVDTFQDEAAFNMLNEIRNERVQPPAEPPFSAMPLASRADAPSGGEEGPGPLPPEDMLDPFASDIPFEDEMETASTTPAADAEVVEEAAVPVGGDETASAPATTGDAEA